MCRKNLISAFTYLASLLILTIAPPSFADAIVDDELAFEISKHQAIDSVKIWIRESGYPPAWIFLRSKFIFSLTDVEIQKVADFSAELFRRKYPTKNTVRINLIGERRGLEHTIFFEGRANGSVVKREVACSDFRCNIGAFLDLHRAQ